MTNDFNQKNSPQSDNSLTSKNKLSFFKRVRRTILGPPRDLKDPKIFHHISLVAFLAWVGLGADGLSSSAYGPEEAFRALGEHTYLAIFLFMATAFTIFIIAYSYSHIIEHFPYGGGGYVVASKMLGSKFGVVSGSALLVDYVFTISVSIAAAADQIFSFLSPDLAQYKLVFVTFGIVTLMLLNLRGVKESTTTLVPIFLLFLFTHAILIFGGIILHAFEAPRVVGEIRQGFNNGLGTLGLLGMIGLLAHAYTRGAGTYTGIEAVSNGMLTMREPKVKTARRTMIYMGVSLAVTAGGILICYLLYNVTPEPGKTMNAVLLDKFAGSWSIGDFPAGSIFVITALIAEAALLFVAAQAGFIDGPRVMSNMAIDSWLPHRFSTLSDKLSMQNGIILITLVALFTLYVTKGDTRMLVLMYSINVFLTFSLSQLGMIRYWIQNRKKYKDWSRHILVFVVGFTLCVSILIISLYEKFDEGGWITIIITGALVFICIIIKRRYNKVLSHLSRLDDVLKEIPTVPSDKPIPAVNLKLPTAVILVSSFGGLGIHTFLTVLRLFPNHFKNFIFVSVTLFDAGSMKGAAEVDNAIEHTKADLLRYIDFTHRLGLAAEYRTSTGTEVLEEAVKISLQIAKESPQSVFFTGKLVFEKERWFQRILHNETATQFQRRVHFEGVNAMVLPIRVFAKAKIA